MGKIGKICKLSELKIGEEGIVSKLNITDRKIRRHLLDMGLTRGTRVRVKKIAPMGDPIDIELRGYELAVKKAELAHIEVEMGI